MAGEAFTMDPQEVVALAPEYHNVTTPSESMKKEYLNISSTPVEKFRLIFKGLSNADKEILLAHYNNQSGGYSKFTWETVPSYIDGASNNDKDGRWIDKSLRMNPVGPTLWDCEITFEEDI